MSIGHSVIPAREVTLQTISDDIALMKASLSNVEADVGTMKSDIDTLKTDIGLIQDEFPNKDDETGCMPVIDIEHHEVHEGEHFFYVDSITLNSGASQDYLITAHATKRTHFLFVADSTAITTVALYENGDRNGTTGQTIYNSDRNSANAPLTTIHKGTSGGSTDGTVIRSKTLGVSTAGARFGLIDRSNEIILHAGQKYIIRVSSGTNGNLIATEMRWYEEPV